MKYESILESLLYYSPNFKSILSKIDDPIAKDIMDMEGKNITQDITFIDIDDNGVVTFAPMAKSIKKISRFLDKSNEMDINFDPIENNDLWKFDSQGIGPDVYSGVRNQIRIGKLVNKILGSKYNDSQIEKFVNRLKSKLETKYHFEIISGDEIIKAYDSKEYAHKGAVGSLGTSCMNNRNVFDLYTKNPDVCKMLVLKDIVDGEHKIVGRALVWKLNTCNVTRYEERSNSLKIDSRYFLDRIYVSHDYLENNFIEYAKENNWIYKAWQNQNDKESIVYKKRILKAIMSVKVKPGEYSKYPYMDTFSRLDIKNGTLHNDRDSKKQGHILTSVEGTYWSKYYPNIIRKFKDYFSS